MREVHDPVEAARTRLPDLPAHRASVLALAGLEAPEGVFGPLRAAQHLRPRAEGVGGDETRTEVRERLARGSLDEAFEPRVQRRERQEPGLVREIFRGQAQRPEPGRDRVVAGAGLELRAERLQPGSGRVTGGEPSSVHRRRALGSGILARPRRLGCVDRWL